MRKIALTGNIASGKSEVQKILVSLGYKVLDTDIVGHELLHNNTEVKNAFAEYDIIENNEISREKLGKVVTVVETDLQSDFADRQSFFSG